MVGLKKRPHTQKSHPKCGKPQRYSWGTHTQKTQLPPCQSIRSVLHSCLPGQIFACLGMFTKLFIAQRFQNKSLRFVARLKGYIPLWLFWNGPGLVHLLFKLSHSVCFVDHESASSALKYGVPQSSVLGPLLFTLYIQSLSNVICQSGHSYHFFADDSQLHISSVPSDFPALVHSLKDCIEDVAE